MDWLGQTKDAADAAANWVQAAAFLAGILGIIRYFREKRLERQGAARALYTAFMTASIQYPDMYGGAWTDNSLNTKTLKQKYIYYVGLFLWSAEELLREFGEEKSWVETIKVTMREHADYLGSAGFDPEESGYSEELRRLIRETV